MKLFTLITNELVAQEKGKCSDRETRYISPADGLFRLFMRSLGSRQDSLDGLPPKEYFIYDNNPKHIEMFKYMLKWDGTIETFDAHVAKGAHNIGITVRPFMTNRTIGRMMRHHFSDFKRAWDRYRTSSFTFWDVDVVEENEKFLQLLNDNVMKTIERRFYYVHLGFGVELASREKYTDSINNCLHLLWLKSFKNSTSLVEILHGENQELIEDFAGKLYAKLNPTFCILPWIHVQYKPNGQSKLCCRYDTVHEHSQYKKLIEGDDNIDPALVYLSPERTKLGIGKSSIENTFFNSNYWNTARKYTENKKPITGCHKCYKEEQSYEEVGTSMRLGSSVLYNGGYLHKIVNRTQPQIEFLEIGFGNYCNLACLSCNSTLSTTWHDDELHLNEKLDSKFNKLQRVISPKLDNIQFNPSEETLKTLKIIKFTGGEPMINPEFTKFIDLICEKGNPEQISLEIYTNCSYIPSNKLTANLIKFKAIQLNLSIDAQGSANDYIRYGSTWQGNSKQTVSNAIDYWLEIGKNNPNIRVIMSSTLSFLNMLEIPKLLTWWIDKFKASGNKILIAKHLTGDEEYEGFFKLQMATDPAYINPNILPKEYYSDLEAWAIKFRNDFFINYPDLDDMPECINYSLIKLQQAINRSTGNVEQGKNLVEYLRVMDEKRKNSFKESLPEAHKLLEDYLNKNAS